MPPRSSRRTASFSTFSNQLSSTYRSMRERISMRNQRERTNNLEASVLLLRNQFEDMQSKHDVMKDELSTYQQQLTQLTATNQTLQAELHRIRNDDLQHKRPRVSPPRPSLQPSLQPSLEHKMCQTTSPVVEKRVSGGEEDGAEWFTLMTDRPTEYQDAVF